MIEAEQKQRYPRKVILSRDEQRKKYSRQMMLGVQLWAHLHNLMAGILAGDIKLIPEFQEYVQFASTNIRESLLAKLDKHLAKGKQQQ